MRRNPSVPLSLAKTHEARWPSRSEFRQLYADLTALGLPSAQVCIWMAGAPAEWSAGEAVVEAQRWLPTPMYIEDAIQWAAAIDYTPQDALAWRAAGVTLPQAVFIHDAVLYADYRIKEFEDWGTRERAWQLSGLPAAWMCLGAALGQHPRETIALRRWIDGDPQMLRQVQGYAVARGADPISLTCDVARLFGLKP